ncbi:uncharacterized protein TrAtP1_000901 [Trichoderma atroviride]|uniref:uncharacterized protein n=1 Tax=Hypocrea atroviridis TaxID=63577 RepID=UPI0033220F04|nr:hypothetical protein TrAtP1_000901 [Trichoderma atroviride]
MAAAVRTPQGCPGIPVHRRFGLSDGRLVMPIVSLQMEAKAALNHSRELAAWVLSPGPGFSLHFFFFLVLFAFTFTHCLAKDDVRLPVYEPRRKGERKHEKPKGLPSIGFCTKGGLSVSSSLFAKASTGSGRSIFKMRFT